VFRSWFLLHLAGEAFAKRNDGKAINVFVPFVLFCGKSTAVFRLKGNGWRLRANFTVQSDFLQK
jgi:hypothetical protein